MLIKANLLWKFYGRDGIMMSIRTNLILYRDIPFLLNLGLVHEDKSMEIVFKYDDEMKKLITAMEQRKGETA